MLTIVKQAYSFVRLFCQYMIPVAVFVYCYGRIFHTIRRQSKAFTGHVVRSQDVPMATMSRDQNAGQVQQQATGATPVAKLSRTELNVLKTMITVVALFVICWTVPSVSNFLELLGVSSLCVHYFSLTALCLKKLWYYTFVHNSGNCWPIFFSFTYVASGDPIVVHFNYVKFAAECLL